MVRRMPSIEALLPILACPCCGSSLLNDGESQILCDQGHEFPVVNGVPILFEPEERESIERDYGDATQMQGEYRKSALARVRSLVKRAVGSSLRLPIDPRVARTYELVDGDWRLEIGSGLVEAGPKTVNLDIGMFGGVNVVGSGCRLPFADESFSLIRSLAVLEHIREPQKMIAEMLRVLKPGGYIYTEIPFLQHFHAYPNDFQRLTKQGLRQAFAGCEVVVDGIVSGPSSALTALIGDYCELWTFSDRRWLNDIVRTIPLVLLWPLKFLDHVLVRNRRAHEICSGLYLLCRKPNTPVDNRPSLDAAPSIAELSTDNSDVSSSTPLDVRIHS